LDRIFIANSLSKERARVSISCDDQGIALIDLSKIENARGYGAAGILDMA